MKIWYLALIMVLSLALGACDFNGGVEQGRCVAYDAKAGTVTLVVDKDIDQHNPNYSGEVDTFILPTNPLDLGPEPVAGDRLMVNPEKKEILIFDQASKKPVSIKMTDVEVEKDINSKHPKLKNKEFPIIDQENHTVTIYSPRLQELITFKPEMPDGMENAFANKETWTAGDEVRIAFRNDNRKQAIRFMNVTKTNIFAR